MGLKNWRRLRQTLEKFIQDGFLIFRTEPLTQQIFDRLTPDLPTLFKGQPVASEVNARTQASVNTGNQVAIAGEAQTVQSLSTRIQGMIRKFEQEIQDEKTITQVTVPNILEYQIQYLNLVGFFEEMIQKHKLKSFSGDASKQSVTIQGRPTSIDSVQKTMFDLLLKVTKSKASMTKKAPFVKVFKTASAEQTIRQQFLAKKIVALWCLENKTVTVYSESEDVSQTAIDCIDSIVWESQYPAENKFDEQEKKVLESEVWKKKKEEIQTLNQPLAIAELEDKSALAIAGLMQVKAVVIENINMFFSNHVQRTNKFCGTADRIAFLYKWNGFAVAELESKHNAKLDLNSKESAISITGTKDDVANCSRSLKKLHDAVCKEIHVITHQAMIHHIEIEQEFLESIGLKTKCLVVKHKEEVAEATAPEEDSGDIGTRYTLTLPSGTVCEVRKDDITVLGCDAIVNAANGDLQHVGGLALNVTKKGRRQSNYIDARCVNF